MSSTIIWIRHGTCLDGLRKPPIHARDNSHLSFSGIAEIIGSIAKLKKVSNSITLVVSSPLCRARESAKIIASSLLVSLSPPIDVFSEWKAPDSVIGLSCEEYPPEYIQWRTTRHLNPLSAPLGGESLHDFFQRAKCALVTAQMLSLCYGDIVVVSHKLLIGAIYAIHHGHDNASKVFSIASSFDLAPSQIWIPSQDL